MSLSTQIAIIQLVIPYFFLWFASHIKQRSVTQKRTTFFFVGLLVAFIFSYIEGNRYDVGNDWMQYKDVYETIRTGGNLGYQEDRLEAGYLLFNQIIASTNVHYTIFFFIESFFLITTLIYIFQKNKKHAFIGVALFICIFRIYHENLSRQFLAHTILILGVYIYYNKSKIKGSIIALISGLFHFSSFPIIIIFYVLSKFDIKKIKLQYIVISFILILILSELIIKTLLGNYLTLMSIFTSRELYANIGEGTRYYSDDVIPISRILIKSCTNLYVIITGYFYIIQTKFEKYRTFLYVLTTIGLSLMIPFQRYELLYRYNFYFTTFFPIFFAYLMNEYKGRLFIKYGLWIVFIYFIYCYIGECSMQTFRFV